MAGKDEPMTQAGFVIPTYNDAQFLRPGLIALAAQTAPPQQVVVVDDGTTSEASLDALSELKREFPSVSFLHQGNAGPSVARNRGVAEIVQPIVGFLDADDSLRDDSAAVRLAHFSANPDLVGAYCGFSSCDSDGRRRQSSFVETPPALLDADGIGRAYPGGLPLWMVRTDAVRAVGGFDSKLTIMEDFDLLLRLARLGGDFAGDNTPAYLRTVRPGSHSRGSARHQLAGTLQFLSKARDNTYFSRSELLRRYGYAFAGAARSALGA